MINIEVGEIDSDQFMCFNVNCKHLSEYHYAKYPNPSWKIKRGTICAFLEMPNFSTVYCFDCIDELYQVMKSKLDKKLWAFK